jgi:antitoxin (DNA-binding transcriptional repressor) of toxin-antitoxin stability system
MKAIVVPATISITELRQRLFQLADRVVETGEPLVIERRGVRLRLVREDAPHAKGGRLSRLVRQDIVVGPPLDPHESPAEWSGDFHGGGLGAKVAEPSPPKKTPGRRRSR